MLQAHTGRRSNLQIAAIASSAAVRSIAGAESDVSDLLGAKPRQYHLWPRRSSACLPGAANRTADYASLGRTEFPRLRSRPLYRCAEWPHDDVPLFRRRAD